MKQFFLFLLVSSLLVIFTACTPMLRITNDTGTSIAAMGYTEATIEFDNALFDLTSLENGDSTPYKFVKKGTSHPVTMTTTQPGGTDTFSDTMETIDMQNFKKYSWKLTTGGEITED